MMAAVATLAALVMAEPDLRILGMRLSVLRAGSSDIEIGAELDRLRSLRQRGAAAAPAVYRLLDHRHPLYSGRDKFIVTRLRTQLFFTLSEIGLPPSAIPALVDTIAYFDSRLDPAEYGAAVRAAASLGAEAHMLKPYLLRMLGEPVAQQEFSLGEYRQGFDRTQATTLEIEVARTLARICAEPDPEVLEALKRLESISNGPGGDRRAGQAARAAIQRIAKMRRPK